MNEQLINQILASLSKIESKVDAINASLHQTKQDLAEYKTAQNNMKDDIRDLYSIHTECSKERCDKYNKLAEIEKKIGTVELLWKCVVGIGGLVVIITTIARFFGLGV